MACSVRERISSTSTILSWFPRSNGSCSSWPISPGLAHQGRENLDRAHVDHDHLIFTHLPFEVDLTRPAPPSSPTTLRYHRFQLWAPKEFITLALEEAPAEAQRYLDSK